MVSHPVSANTVSGSFDYGFWSRVADGTGGLGQVDPSILRAYGDDQLGLWGETDPEELLDFWLQIAANREEWNRLGREHADALKSLSWRKSMQKLLSLV